MTEGGKTFLGTIILFAIAVFGMYSCSESEWWKAHERAEAMQKQADATPHVIREADGCKVYAFKSGDQWHYFTRCGSTVSTERNWSEGCGKGCTKHRSETIVTEGNA